MATRSQREASSDSPLTPALLAAAEEVAASAPPLSDAKRAKLRALLDRQDRVKQRRGEQAAS